MLQKMCMLMSAFTTQKFYESQSLVQCVTAEELDITPITKFHKLRNVFKCLGSISI